MNIGSLRDARKRLQAKRAQTALEQGWRRGEVPEGSRRWVVADHKRWSDNICHDGEDGNQHRWVGWTTPHVKVGDVFVAKTQGGLTAEFLVVEARSAWNVDDMWYARTWKMGRVVP